MSSPRRPGRLTGLVMKAGAWRLAAGLAAAACWVALGVLSLLPAERMARTSLGGLAEHCMAYAGTGVLTALGLGAARAWRAGVLLVAYAGALEVGQHFSPGRHPAWLDWVASSSGALAGVAGAVLIAPRLWAVLQR